jgi:hypothetical protein
VYFRLLFLLGRYYANRKDCYENIIIVALIAIAISCKSRVEDTAQKAIDRYIILVDPVNEASMKAGLGDGKFIAAEHERKKKMPRQFCLC